MLLDHCHQRHINLWLFRLFCSFFSLIPFAKFIEQTVKPFGGATFTFVFVIGWCLFYVVARCFFFLFNSMSHCDTYRCWFFNRTASTRATHAVDTVYNNDFSFLYDFCHHLQTPQLDEKRKRKMFLFLGFEHFFLENEHHSVTPVYEHIELIALRE